LFAYKFRSAGEFVTPKEKMILKLQKLLIDIENLMNLKVIDKGVN